MSLAFVFPGQGSQAVGMLDSLAAVPAVAALIAEADAALGEPLSRLIADGPAESLALTVNTQPAMLLAGLACYRAWRDAGGPDAAMVAGHSLGEYTALTAADALRPADAFRLVRLRARAMQEAVPVGSGAMAAILGLDDEKVMLACAQATESFAGMPPRTAGVADVVEAANFNSPGQVVIAGSTAAVAKACEVAKALGAKRAMPLAVSAPFHSSLLQSAGRRLGAALREVTISPPRVPVVDNVDVAVQSDPVAIADALVRQSYGAVRWVEVMHKLVAMGATHVIEFGPGKVLSGLARRIAPAVRASAVYDAASLEATLKEVR